MNRREFTQLAALGPLGFMFSNPTFAVEAVLPRENINTFSKSSDKVTKLRAAVFALSSRPITDASSWFNMAAIHMIARADVVNKKPPSAISALYNQCHSDEGLFFLWHRAYVWSMERLMQEAVGDKSFRLPYWDWYESPAIPEIFRFEYLSDGKTENSLYRKNRNDGVNKGLPVWRPVVKAQFGSDSSENGDFEAFQHSLNYGEHGDIHVAVGTSTNMGDANTAARDPIFWLHHANIDRLLPVWLNIDSKRVAKTTYPSWLKTKYRFPAPDGGLQTPTVNELNMSAMGALGYSYESISLPKDLAPITPARPTLSAGSLGPTTGMKPMTIAQKQAVKIGSGATLSLSLSSGNGMKMQATANDVKDSDGFTSVVIVLDGIKLNKSAPGVLSYGVYLNLPSKESTSSNFYKHYLGPISLFALNHDMPGHEGMKHRTVLRFSVTEMLKEQAKINMLNTNSINVSIIPVLAPDAKEPAEPVIEIEHVSIEASSNPTE